MTSWATSPGVRRSMQSNRPRDTQPELALRSALHRAGLRFRKHVRPVPGLACEADVVFPSPRLVVFLDGCFWHGCPIHGSRPRSNPEFWSRKLDGNRRRDQEHDLALKAAGWHVQRVWEHTDVPDAVTAIQDRLTELRVSGERGGRRPGTDPRPDVGRAAAPSTPRDPDVGEKQ